MYYVIARLIKGGDMNRIRRERKGVESVNRNYKERREL
jgi:hypothetical protein